MSIGGGIHQADCAKANNHAMACTCHLASHYQKESVEAIDHPSHYKRGGIEAIDVIEAWDLGFCLGNTIKYISRAGIKDDAKFVEDLKKARWYLDREIARWEKP